MATANLSRKRRLNKQYSRARGRVELERRVHEELIDDFEFPIAAAEPLNPEDQATLAGLMSHPQRESTIPINSETDHSPET